MQAFRVQGLQVCGLGVGSLRFRVSFAHGSGFRGLGLGIGFRDWSFNFWTRASGIDSKIR